ncbi:MAG: zinc-binding dehydrogenase, partial [Gaiellales bacterium]
LTGVGAVERAASVAAGQSVLVIGAGGVGQFAVQAARLARAAPVIVVDPIAARCCLALELGASAAVTPAELPDVLARECPDGVDHAIEVVGSAQTVQAAVDATRPGGRVTLVGLPPAGTRLDLDPFQLVAQEKTISGSMYGSEGPAVALPRLLDHVATGRLSLERMLGPRFPLDRVNEAVEASLAGSPGRVMLTPRPGGNSETEERTV